jgi:16S rRNA (guanine(966)-N(2))-methyltransferase RsmD
MQAKKQNSVKINAGVWRSRVIRFPDVLGLRPTPERVRQTVFNWLGQELTGQHCLDLFAGTGVMGFEALSRGATTATLLEIAKPAVQALHENKQLLQAQDAQIIAQDALHFLSHNTQKFDVIFCDPPYNQGWLTKILPLLKSAMNVDGKVYVEAEFALDSVQNVTPNFANDWQILKQKKAGNVFYHLIAPQQAFSS